MEKYIQLKKGLNDFGRIIPLKDLEDEKKLENYIKSAPKKDWYISLYYYDEEAKKYFDKNNGSIRGFKGKALSNKLVFDFDSKNLEEAQTDTMELLYRLRKEGIDILKNVKVFWSGSKGFHVEVPIIDSLKPDELKIICSNIAKDLDTFDKVIYNTNRAYRLRDTVHQKSGLHKIELDPDDILNLSCEQIKSKAKLKSLKIYKTVTVSETSFLDKYRKKITKSNKPVIVDVEEVDGIRGLDTIDFNKMPKHIPRCVYALEHGVMVPGVGERSQIFLRLAAYYRNQGDSKDKAYNSLRAVARLNSRLYPEAELFTKDEIWNTSINSAYSDSWKQVVGATGFDAENPIFKKYCEAIGKYTDRTCILHNKVEKKSSIIQIEEAFDSFSAFAENFEKNTISTGIKFVDDYMKITTGTTTLIAGAAGSGKTTLCLNIMENANKNGLHTMFFSMDMHKNLVTLKLAQKLTPYKQHQILEMFKNKDRKRMIEVREALKSHYSKTYFDFSSSLTFEQMRDKVLETEERTGNKIKLVVVDYVGRIVSDKSDSYANAKYNALKSVEVANETDAAWLLLSQISRNSGDGSSPIRTKRAAKDSGDWEESATNVITMWRPFLGAESFGNPLWTDDTMRLYLAKNRMGSELEKPLYWNGAKGLIKDLKPQEIQEYLEKRQDQEKEFRKAKNDKD